MLLGKKLSGSSVFIILLFQTIIVLAVCFHHGVYLSDAITGDRIDDIIVTISPWRIVLEPFLGPIMFCLRGHDPLDEFFVLMVWVLAILLFVGLVRNMRAISGSIFHRFGLALLHWLATVPVVLILWIGLLLFMIFAPLPTNTIISNRDDTALVNFHSHSYYSHDGLISPENLLKWHRRNGFDAFFITEHNHHRKTLEFITAREARLSIDEDVCVLPGQEYSGSNHLLLLGLTHNFITKNMPDSVAVDTVHAQGGVVIVAHWFADEHNSIQHYIDYGVDGFEIANQGEGIDYDRHIFRDIVSACQKNLLLMLGDTDYHGYGNACYVWNALKISHWDSLSYSAKKDSIMSILRNRDSRQIQIMTYCDRRFLNRALIMPSPLFNAIDYIRSLNIWQIVSWVIWLLGLLLVVRYNIFRSVITWFKGRPFRVAGIVGLMSASYVFAIGIYHLLMASQLIGFNEIFKENGTYYVIGGGIFIMYSSVLLRIKIKRH